ncbi:hypothetical protein DXZ79_01100 [Yersinia rochesterensis]|uniref:Uncharacterized protein n=1 Tax=Yersinia rochesterensis TaxID=1604335 RepID=A0A8D4MYD7_9GAMM|nr:hypothetical protein DXZ79_01100 [Yersinia rochesterensis]
MTGVTNLRGADLNAACSGLAEARPMDGPSSESSQHICSLKYDRYNIALFTLDYSQPLLRIFDQNEANHPTNSGAVEPASPAVTASESQS